MTCNMKRGHKWCENAEIAEGACLNMITLHKKATEP